tara:strand:- start:943 stop:1407 length:465 start_codon:yes stop_codon:yes gene_type:complete
MDSTPSPIQLFPSDAIRRSVLATIEQGGCEALLGNMRGQPRSAAQQLGVDFLGEHEHWRRIRTKLTQMDPRAFADLSEEMSLQDVSTALPEIDCPTTIIVGEHDQPFREPARIMTNLIPKANLQVIEGAAHSPQYENAEAWKAAVRGHLLANGP